MWVGSIISWLSRSSRRNKIVLNIQKCLYKNSFGFKSNPKASNLQKDEEMTMKAIIAYFKEAKNNRKMIAEGSDIDLKCEDNVSKEIDDNKLSEISEESKMCKDSGYKIDEVEEKLNSTKKLK
ncbi:hypothetical protein AVEN_144302-1 [Araneus ventricosus]|uniref:Uncharacterized protein n=1 Tax=Araneus ventricosus TaxID=182803 RepID=A0A4Y2C1B6_ARAVE|nr:hypothetical protein AVEN_144302-1 [Araneus ventricosus]